jgi:hypothetical protein
LVYFIKCCVEVRKSHICSFAEFLSLFIVFFTVKILSAQKQPCWNPFCCFNNMTSAKSWILLLITVPSRKINPW